MNWDLIIEECSWEFGFLNDFSLLIEVWGCLVNWVLYMNKIFSVSFSKGMCTNACQEIIPDIVKAEISKVPHCYFF